MCHPVASRICTAIADKILQTEGVPIVRAKNCCKNGLLAVVFLKLLMVYVFLSVLSYRFLLIVWDHQYLDSSLSVRQINCHQEYKSICCISYDKKDIPF